MRRKEIAETVFRIVSDVSSVSRREFTQESFLREDLGLDSLDIEGIVLCCEQEFMTRMKPAPRREIRRVSDVVDLVCDSIEKEDCHD